MNIELFNFHGNEVRVIADDSDNPLWIASDVSRILGFSSPAAMTRSIRGKHKGLQTIHTPGGKQSVTVLKEAGLYAAVLKSRRPEAIEFQEWVLEEVLPSIRKHGGYLISRKGSDWNTPTQKSMELELFRIKENTVVHSDGHTSITKTSKVTGKGREYFII